MKHPRDESPDAWRHGGAAPLLPDHSGSSDDGGPAESCRSRFAGLVEFSPHFLPRPEISHVLFDFDGTLSLIRHGWVEVMVEMFAELLPPAGETLEQRREMCREEIMRINGKQTIYQMIKLANRIRERGGHPQDPLWYKHEYLRRLEGTIGSRKEGVRSGTIHPDQLLVYQARPFLRWLRDREFHLYLASGTDEVFVKEEADLVQLTEFFGSHIYGALDDYRKFSKKMVIKQILREHRIPGAQLLSFGDGFVEIQNTREAGGLAVAVATDEEHNGAGRFDPWKRQRLTAVGADVVIPDYRDASPLMDRILSV